jgi:hypothetical protein
MPTITATAGDAAANSFVLLAEAEAYFEARLNAAPWNDAAEDDRVRALIEATTEISALPFQGYRVTETQALAWPRSYAPNPDAVAPALTGNEYTTYFAENVIPTRVKRATYEYALAFLVAAANSRDLAVSDPSLNVLRTKTDVLETEYVDPSRRVRGPGRFPRVMAQLQPLLDPTRTGGLRVVRT